MGSAFNDDPLWLVLAVAAYLKETGDASILDEASPSTTSLARSARSPSISALPGVHAGTGLAPAGLPLIGHADWNNCLNLNCFSETPGESFRRLSDPEWRVAELVFIAGLFVLAAGELAALAEMRGDAPRRHPGAGPSPPRRSGPRLTGTAGAGAG